MGISRGYVKKVYMGVHGVHGGMESNVIYLIHQQFTNYYKIGFTDGDPGFRLRQLQGGNPMPLRLVIAVEGGRDMESAIHRKHADCRVEGEWFSFSAKRLQKMLQHDLGVDPDAVTVNAGDYPLITTFPEWLRDQRLRDDVVGDFARDAIADSHGSKPGDRAGERDWRQYLSMRNVHSGVRQAMKQAWAEYREAVKKA